MDKRNGFVLFNLQFILLLIKVDSILKEWSCKKNTFITYYISCFKIIFILLIKVITFYIRASIV